MSSFNNLGYYSKRKKRKSQDGQLLRPLTRKPKRKGIAVYDIESKHDDTQNKGFTRAFMVSLYDGYEYYVFRNDPGLERLPWKERALADGGCIDKFMRFILEEKTPEGEFRFCNRLTNIYAHNGGKFDHTFLLSWLLKNRKNWQLAERLTDEDFGEYTFSIVGVQGKIQKMDVWPRFDKKIRKESSVPKFTFLDSIQLLTMSLEEAGKNFNASDAQKMRFDLDMVESDPRWEEYNKTDCRVLYQVLENLHDMVEHEMGGEVGITTSSTTMKLWRRRYQNKPIHRNSHFANCSNSCDLNRDEITGSCDKREICDSFCHGCNHEWLRPWYFGGRTELFEEFAEDCRYYDINSSYGASMLEPMPVGKMVEVGPKGSLEPYEDSSRWVGFVEATVYIPPDCPIPPLPFREKKAGKTIFPACKSKQFSHCLTGIWSWEELRLLSDWSVNGKIMKIYRSVWYPAEPVFAEMMHDMYRIKNQHKGTGLSILAKLFGNGLYGKFAMRPERSKLIVLDPWEKEFPVGGQPVNGDFANDVLWDVEAIAKAAYIIPQISAHICALARCRLFMAMSDVMWHKGRVIYTDTDSILCNIDMPLTRDGKERVGDKLGQWKRENPGARIRVECHRPKFYRMTSLNGVPFEKEHKEYGSNGKCIIPGCKGCATIALRMKGVQRPTNDKWERMLRGEEIQWDRPQMYRTIARRGLSCPEMTIAKKSIRSEYDKRVMMTDGTSRPLLMGEHILGG